MSVQMLSQSHALQTRSLEKKGVFQGTNFRVNLFDCLVISVETSLRVDYEFVRVSKRHYKFFILFIKLAEGDIFTLFTKNVL